MVAVVNGVAVTVEHAEALPVTVVVAVEEGGALAVRDAVEEEERDCDAVCEGVPDKVVETRPLAEPALVGLTLALEDLDTVGDWEWEPLGVTVQVEGPLSKRTTAARASTAYSRPLVHDPAIAS